MVRGVRRGDEGGRGRFKVTDDLEREPLATSSASPWRPRARALGAGGEKAKRIDAREEVGGEVRKIDKEAIPWTSSLNTDERVLPMEAQKNGALR